MSNRSKEALEEVRETLTGLATYLTRVQEGLGEVKDPELNQLALVLGTLAEDPNEADGFVAIPVDRTQYWH